MLGTPWRWFKNLKDIWDLLVAIVATPLVVGAVVRQMTTWGWESQVMLAIGVSLFVTSQWFNVFVLMGRVTLA